MIKMVKVSKKHHWFLWLIAVGVVAIIALMYVGAMLMLPLPRPTISMNVQSGSVDTGVASDMNWPNSGVAALSAPSFGVLQTNNTEGSRPMASMAKIILAIAVLKQRPIESGQSGPTLVITDADYQFYLDEIARNGSTVAVQVGEQLTEYQALQALLLPSGNNMATTLAVWSFGSEAKYVEYANGMLQDMGLSQTVVADASGYSDSTVSTVEDLTVIGNEALKNPILKEIVSQKSADVPVAGRLVNTNSALGISDINGIKTGQTDAAGDCLLFSATRTIGDEDITLVGALQAMPGDDGAVQAAPGLVEQGFANFAVVEGISEGQVVGAVYAPWSAPVNVRVAQKIEQTVWRGSELKRTVTASAALYGVVGKIVIGDKSADLVLDSSIAEPSVWWRLTHPVDMIKANS